MAAATEALQSAKSKIVAAVGGLARLQVIVLLAAVLALDTADKGTVSAVAGSLKKAFGIGNTEIGLIVAVVSFVTAIAALPMGVLVDRLPRRRVLLAALPCWAVGMILSAAATSYGFLLAARIVLGVVTAAAWPCVATLTGDFFPARERASAYGLILAGELIGMGVGFFVAGEVSSVLSWRWSFIALAVPSAVLVWAIWRWLPEPKRGGQSWLRPGERDPEAAAGEGRAPGHDRRDAVTSMQQAVLDSEVKPRQELVLHTDPGPMRWLAVMRYLLQLPSYRLLIVASALAYYFFSGTRAFAMIYFTQHYGLGRASVSALVFVLGAAAIAGVVAGGRISERLLDRGRFNARIVVPAAALFASVPFLAGGIWTRTVWLGILLTACGAGALAAAIAPIDAARLDIVHPRLWGRGEAGRMAVRAGFEGSAPLLFGAMSGWLGGDGTGLMWTFLIMLAPMLIAGSLVILGRRSYPRDVATAAASVEAMAEAEAASAGRNHSR